MKVSEIAAEANKNGGRLQALITTWFTFKEFQGGGVLVVVASNMVTSISSRTVTSNKT